MIFITFFIFLINKSCLTQAFWLQFELAAGSWLVLMVVTHSMATPCCMPGCIWRMRPFSFCLRTLLSCRQRPQGTLGILSRNSHVKNISPSYLRRFLWNALLLSRTRVPICFSNQFHLENMTPVCLPACLPACLPLPFLRLYSITPG